MILTPTSLLAWNQEKQCPGIITLCKTVTRFQGIPLTPFPVLPGIIPVIQYPLLLLPVILCIRILDQWPGLIKRIIVVTRCPPLLHALLFQLLFPLVLPRNVGPGKGGWTGVRQREKLGIVHLFKMRAGPISVQQFQQFQQERPSHFQRPATPHRRGGRQCTRLPGL